MNRTLKFRAWDKLQNKFLNPIGFTILGETTCFDIIGMQLKEFTPNIPTLERLKDVVITQFTGLSDKHGKDIYEGDIVTYKRSVGNWTGKFMITTHKIIFTEEVNAFVMVNDGNYTKLRKHWSYEYEVIGNIFENTELLK